MRILWQSNAPWVPTGYGTQANSLIPRLLAMPEVEDVGVFAFYGIQGAKTRQRIGVSTISGDTKPRTHWIAGPNWIDCYPIRSDMWGNDVVGDHALDFKADIVISLMDIWVLADDYGNKGFRWVPYMPIDMEPPPPPVINKMRRAYLPIVYSQFAKKWCDRFGIETVYIPHGVETQIYKPYPHAKDREEAKELLGVPKDCFLVGTVAANKGFPSRKGFGELFAAFKIFRERHTDARLYMHSIFTSEYGGPQLQEMAEAYGIRQYISFVDPYKLSLGIDTEHMNMIYNAMDVFCLPSRGEGFGIPIIEAQASGTPVIVTDFTSMPELVGAGWTVPVVANDYMPLQSWQGIASVPHIVDALEEAYKTPRKRISKQARDFALKYDWDALVETGWKPLIKRLHEEVDPRTYMSGKGE